MEQALFLFLFMFFIFSVCCWRLGDMDNIIAVRCSLFLLPLLLDSRFTEIDGYYEYSEYSTYLIGHHQCGPVPFSKPTYVGGFESDHSQECLSPNLPPTRASLVNSRLMC